MKMNQDKNHNNCENYKIPECPHINDELMKNLSVRITVNDKEGNTLFSTTEEVNKLCNTCDSFVNKRS
jgi:hypothetical protein